jgi:hypothetical protein
MSTEQIVALLTAERDRLNQAITLLSGTTTSAASAKRRGRPPGKKAVAKLPTPMQATPASMPEPKPARRKRRKLSADARARIAAAQKKRWAEFRKK